MSVSGKGNLQAGSTNNNKQDEHYKRFQSQGPVPGHRNEQGHIMHDAMHKSTAMPSLNVKA